MWGFLGKNVSLIIKHIFPGGSVVHGDVGVDFAVHYGFSEKVVDFANSFARVDILKG